MTKAKTERRSRQGEDSRQRILDATLELAHELGYTATSISKVSERSGLPASSVYWHFENKDHLFAAVIEESFERWERSLPTWDPPDAAGDLAALVVQRINSAVGSIAASPDFWRLGLLLALENHPVEPTARQRFIDIRAGVLADLARFWDRVLPPTTDGEERHEVGRRLARFTLATVDGLFVAAQAEPDADLTPMADILAAALLGAAQRLGGVPAGVTERPWRQSSL